MYWSDQRSIYFAVVYSGLAILALLAIWPAISGKSTVPIRGTICYLALLFLWIFLARWPGLFYFVGFLIDEDQFLAAARALVEDPVFFRSTEAGSSGPLNIYPLLLPLVVGQMPTLLSGRVVGLLMTCGSLAMLRVYLRFFLGESPSRVIVLFPAMLFGMTSFWDFSHYSSELTPVLFLSAGLVLLAYVALSPPRSGRLWIALAAAAAFFFSLVPFAKLQATYLALGAGLALVAAIATQKKFPWPTRIWCLAFTVFGALLFPAMFGAWMIRSGVFDYFLKSYFMNAVAYVASGHDLNCLVLVKMVLGKVPEYQVYLAGWGACVAVIAVWLVVPPRKMPPARLLVGSGFALFLLAITAYTIAAPRRDWGHYLLFSPIILALVLGMLVGCLSSRLKRSDCGPILREKSDLLLCVLVLGLCCLPLLGFRLSTPHQFLGAARTWHKSQKEPYSAVGKGIANASAGTNGKLVVWGYNPNYHTETGLVQATRLSISSAQFNENSLKEFFRQTYLDDLRRNRPGVFVDATAKNQFPALNDPEKFRHEVVPGVRDFVAQNYRLVDDVDGVRIYRLVAAGSE